MEAINKDLINALYQNDTKHFNIKHIEDIYKYFLSHPEDVNKEFYNPKINKKDCLLFYALRQDDCIILLLLNYVFNIDFNIKCNNLNCIEYIIDNYLYNNEYIKNFNKYYEQYKFCHMQNIDYLQCIINNLKIKLLISIKYYDVNTCIFEFKNLKYFLEYYYKNKLKLINQFKYKHEIIVFINELIKKYHTYDEYDKNLVNKKLLEYTSEYNIIANNIENDNFDFIVNIILSIINNNDEQFKILLENHKLLKYDYYFHENNLISEYMNNNFKLSFIDINIKYMIMYIDCKYMSEDGLNSLIKLEIKNIFKKDNVTSFEIINLIDKYNNLLIEYNKHKNILSNYPIFEYICNNGILNYYIYNISTTKLIDIINKSDNIYVIQYIFTSLFFDKIKNIKILEHIIKNHPKMNLLTKDIGFYQKNNFDYNRFFNFYEKYYEYDNVKELCFNMIKIYKNLNYFVNNIDINKYNFYINPSKVFNNDKYPNKYIKVSFLHVLSCIKEFKYYKHIQSIKLICNKYPELINDNNNELKLTPLHCALILKNKKIIKKVLLKYDINVYIDDINNINPFEYIILNNYTQSYVKMLIDKYDIYKYHNNENIIIMLIRLNNIKIIKFMYEYFKEDYDFYNYGIINWIMNLYIN